jgi:crossover junction endodeoxyribonuclease RuvC
VIFIGIDPGLKGGLVALSLTTEGTETLSKTAMPVVNGELDEAAIRAWLLKFYSGFTRVYIEKVSAMPKQGVCSMFTFGTGWGLIRGICCGLNLSYNLVRPQTWQKIMLQDMPKDSEYAVVSRLWPKESWLATERSKKPHSGIIDAALLAAYGAKTSNIFRIPT